MYLRRKKNRLIKILVCTRGRESTMDGRSGRILSRPKGGATIAPGRLHAAMSSSKSMKRNTLRFLQCEMPQSKVRK